MPEGGNNGAAHSILDGLYELHETIGTGGFAKVIYILVGYTRKPFLPY